MHSEPPLGASDEELATRFRETGDERSFGELFERHRRRIFQACRRFCNDDSEADAATQETFLRAFANTKVGQGGDFGAWLTRIARNVCIDQWRKRRRELLIGGMDDVAQLDAGETNSPSVALMATTVRHEMAALPADQRRCLEMKIAGYSYEETAAYLDIPIAAVKSHLQNGRRMLWQKVRAQLPRVGSDVE